MNSFNSVFGVAEGDVGNVLRIVVIMWGGFVVGAGAIILLERACFYERADLPYARRAMIVLIFVNALVMTFIALSLIARWNEGLSWRWLLAIAIFATKAVFFRDLRALGLEQERRSLYST